MHHVASHTYARNDGLFAECGAPRAGPADGGLVATGVAAGPPQPNCGLDPRLGTARMPEISGDGGGASEPDAGIVFTSYPD